MPSAESDDADFDKLSGNLDELAATPTLNEFEAERRNRIRGQKVLVALMFLIILGGYFFTYIVAQDVGRASARAELLSSTVESLVASNDAREARGLPPIDYGDIVAKLNDEGIVQAVASAVIAQIEADPTLQGPAGINGAPGAPGAIGQPGIGINGLPGGQGAVGQPGVQGAPGAAGAQGAQGSPGDTGAPGAEGAQGPPPESFTINGQKCTRVGATADYDCQPIVEGP